MGDNCADVVQLLASAKFRRHNGGLITQTGAGSTYHIQLDYQKDAFTRLALGADQHDLGAPPENPIARFKLNMVLPSAHMRSLRQLEREAKTSWGTPHHMAVPRHHAELVTPRATRLAVLPAAQRIRRDQAREGFGVRHLVYMAGGGAPCKPSRLSFQNYCEE